MSNTRNMTRGKPLGLLIVFALPLMFGNIFQQLYTVVDTAIVGRGVGMDALAALGMVVGVVELVLRIAFALFSAGIHWPFGLFVAEVSAWWGGGLIFLVSYYRAARKLLR